MYVVAWDVIFLFPPAGTKRIFSNSQIYWKFFGLVERGGRGEGQGRKEGVEGKIIRKTSINQTSTGIIYVSSTRFFITRHRSPISIYIDLTPKKIIPSKHEEWIARHFRRLQLSTKEALKSICDISKLPHPPPPSDSASFLLSFVSVSFYTGPPLSNKLAV